MKLFKRKPMSRANQTKAILGEIPADDKLADELGELSAYGDRRDVTAADIEVKEAVTKATRDDIRSIKLIEQGRCPVCQGRTENFLYTVVCPSCGWFRRSVPEGGKSVVYLNNGNKIQCDHVYRGGTDEFLCIKDGVVISEIMRSSVRRVDHLWTPDDLERAREQVRMRGLCSWCEKPLEESEEGGPRVDYVAFGVFQERYMFCSEKCQREFRRQYPSRIHRNCYETDCNTCNKCVKRYDTHGFKRTILT